jgi:hypothetical protein
MESYCVRCRNEIDPAKNMCVNCGNRKPPGGWPTRE